MQKAEHPDLQTQNVNEEDQNEWDEIERIASVKMDLQDIFKRNTGQTQQETNTVSTLKEEKPSLHQQLDIVREIDDEDFD